MNKNWRLILDNESDGYYNMAVDEALLAQYLVQKIPTLRIYFWQRPFITLGYRQLREKTLKSCCKIPSVNRVTGGVGILHDQELTYSLVCSLADLNFPQGVKESYQYLCGFLIEFYRRLGIEVSFAQELSYTSVKDNGFCFSSWEFFDLLAQGKKLGGNAQRRKRDIVFQHGSIPIKLNFPMIKDSFCVVDNLEHTVTSLSDFLTEMPDREWLVNLLTGSFSSVFSVNFIESKLSNEEAQLVK